MSKRDLFLLVPDIDIENILVTLFCDRTQALNIDLHFSKDEDILRYNKRDSGCYRDAAELLRKKQPDYKHGLACFDLHGSGAGDKTRAEIEKELEDQFFRNGWPDGSAAAIVIDPEIEMWMWSRSAEVPRIFGWGSHREDLDAFLRKQNLLDPDQIKPSRDPKAALECALREKRKPRVAALYKEVAQKVSLNHCNDPAFKKLRCLLQKWFPEKQ